MGSCLNFGQDDLFIDYYEVIGCAPSSTIEQITVEYRIKALSCHPDKNSENENATQEFALLQTAKDVLTDSEKRKDYDTWRNSGIRIPYQKWASLRDSMKMSMHWAVKKEDPMVKSSQDAETQPHSNSDETPTVPMRDELRRKFRDYEI